MNVTDQPDTDDIEVDDTSVELLAASVKLQALARSLARQDKTVEAKKADTGAANLREIAGYMRRRSSAAQVGDIGLVDLLTERIHAVTRQLPDSTLDVLESPDDDLTPPAPADTPDPEPQAEGSGDLSKATHEELDKFIADNDLDADLIDLKVDDKRAAVAAALADAAGE